MKLENAFNRLDELFQEWFKIDPSKESEYYSRRNRVEEKKDILHDANIIDTKCSALLTHISIMFIVLGIFITNENNHGFVFLLLVIEFIAYVLAAMLLLRCLDLLGPPFRQLPETPPRQNSCRLKFLKKIKFEIRDENVYKVFRGL
jgi:hypothetical protein